MATQAISTQLSMFLTDARNRRKLATFTSSIRIDNYSMSTATLEKGDSVIVDITQFFVAAFPRPTLIRISNAGGSTIEVEANGVFYVSMAGSIEIINPSDSSISLPLVVTYIAG